MTRILRDSVGFAGAKMIRRIVGLAHVEDLESIADRSRRAAAERRALRLARELIVTRTSFQTIDQLVAAASR